MKIVDLVSELISEFEFVVLNYDEKLDNLNRRIQILENQVNNLNYTKNFDNQQRHG